MAKAASHDKETIVLVDGYGLIFRAYFALPASMSTTTGEQTNAVYGFTSMLLDVLNSRKPNYVVIALESGKTFRHDLFEEYKGTRAETPADLSEQIGRIQQLIATLGIPIKQVENYEADDVIGSLSRSLAADGYRVVIVTGDSDLLQLVEDDVLVVLPGARRFGDIREFDTAAVFERYGFGPEFVPDYKALVGDTSDNIPGVPGIGDKTAKTLIATYGSLESILEHQDEVTPTRARNALIEHGEAAPRSKHLATIVRDLPIDINLEEARVGRYDRDEVAELFRELEFRSFLARLPESIVAGNAAPAPRAVEPAQPSIQTIVDSDEKLQHLVERIQATKTIAVDVETTATDPLRATLVGIAIAVTEHESFYVPVGHNDGVQLDIDIVRERLNPVIVDPEVEVYTHHGKYDFHVLTRHGYAQRQTTFDTMIAAYVLGDSSIRLKDLAFTRLGIEMTEISELIGTGKNQATMDTVAIDLAAPYACGDVESTYRLVVPLKAQIVERNQLDLLESIEFPLISVLIRMEQAGVAIDSEELAEFAVELGSRIAGLKQEVDDIAGTTLNLGSNKQLATVLFETLGLQSGRRTKTGYSVDSDVLESLRDQHPLVPLILEYRTLSKLKSTYVDALPLQVNPDTGRVHTSFNQTIAATGRLSSVNPNLQNIPIRTDIGRRVRRSFVADHRPDYGLYKDAVLLAADYSQMELRILAHMSGEPFLIEAFTNGEDIHRATAALVSGVSTDKVTADQRRIAKTVNFGILYGMQAYGLSRDTGMPRAESQAFIAAYWERLPKVKAFFDKLIEDGVRDGYVSTVRGRRRYLPELSSSNGARRQGAQRMAMNMPIQGTQADIVKQAMLNLEGLLTQRSLPATMILQVHDELVLEVSESRLPETAALVKETMETAFQLNVPTIVELRTGQNWEDMRAYPID
ncbi:MAG: DNA polymerase I [Chloroflexota bacterium]|nr:DNA polymerase I [Chloroflexota bacterium]